MKTLAIKRTCFLLIFFIGNHCVYAQKEKDIIDIIITCYEEYLVLNKQEEVVIKTICLPEPDSFYYFFNTNFIDFAALRETEVNMFSFNDSLCSPLKQNLIVASCYGMREKRKHFGVDFKLNVGDTVCSVFCGKVRIAKYDETYGNVVVIRHYNMSETVYAHLDKKLVDVGQVIQVGEPIGLGGNTGRSSGPHLHFELRYKGFPINPIVEYKFLTHIPVY